MAEKKCNCCERPTPDYNMFIYHYKNKSHNLCGICYANIEEYLLDSSNEIKLKLNEAEIKKIQEKNKEINEKIMKLNFVDYPRSFLETFVGFLREKEFNTFKKLLYEFEREHNLKIISKNG